MNKEVKKTNIKTIEQIIKILISDDILNILKLNDRDKQILKLRLEYNYTFKEISNEFGLTPIRCSQIYQKTIRKIKHQIINLANHWNDYIELQSKYNYLLKKNTVLKVNPSLLRSKEEELRLIHSLETPIIDIDFSNRTKNCLNAAEIIKVKDLLNYRKSELIKFRNLGWHSLNEIEYTLAKMNLSLKE